MNGSATYSSMVSVNYNSEDLDIKIFPNPVSGGLLNIVSSSSIQSFIYNSGGALVKSVPLQKGKNTIDVRNLAAGVYFIKTADGKNAKFIVIK